MTRARTHVLIDLDGTISDSQLGIGRSLHHAFVTCGYEPPTDEQVRSAIGPPFEQTFPALGVPAADIPRVIAAYRDRYNDVGLFENELYGGVVQMLTDLAESGLVLALATAKPQSAAIRITEYFGLTDHFTIQVGADGEVGSGRRTKAQVITHALAELAIPPGDHVVMVGDRDHDVEGAIANGIECVGVTWGFGSVEELEAAGAHVIVNTPAEVVQAVCGPYRSSPS